MYVDMPAYLRHLEEKIGQLQDRLLQVETVTDQLREQVDQLRPVHIGQVHYKIQELTVSELSGTLNVGLTALADPQQMEQWLKQVDAEDKSNNPSPSMPNEVQFHNLQHWIQDQGGKIDDD